MIWSQIWEKERNKRWPQIYGLSNKKDRVPICWEEDNCGKNRLQVVVGGECKKMFNFGLLNLKCLLYNKVEMLGVYWRNIPNKFFFPRTQSQKQNGLEVSVWNTHTHKHARTHSHLSTENPRSYDSHVPSNTPNIQILVPKLPSSLKGIRAPWRNNWFQG